MIHVDLAKVRKCLINNMMNPNWLNIQMHIQAKQFQDDDACLCRVLSKQNKEEYVCNHYRFSCPTRGIHFARFGQGWKSVEMFDLRCIVPLA